MLFPCFCTVSVLKPAFPAGTPHLDRAFCPTLRGKIFYILYLGSHFWNTVTDSVSISIAFLCAEGT